MNVSDYINVDKMAPFFGAIIGRCCGFTEAAEPTTAYARYVDVVWKVNKKYEIPRWTLSEIRILKDDIEAFISHRTDFFGTYQVCCMRVSKFSTLTHITGDLWDTGGIGYSCGCL